MGNNLVTVYCLDGQFVNDFVRGYQMLVRATRAVLRKHLYFDHAPPLESPLSHRATPQSPIAPSFIWQERRQASGTTELAPDATKSTAGTDPRAFTKNRRTSDIDHVLDETEDSQWD